MIIDFKTGKEKKTNHRPPRPDKFKDSQGNYITRYGDPITDPVVIAELDRINSIPRNERSVKDTLRLSRLRRDGDNAKGKNKFTPSTPDKPFNPSYSELNIQDPEHPATTDFQQAAQAVIDDIYTGTNPIQAIKNQGLTPKKFYNMLDEEQNFKLLKSYEKARESLAEFAIYKMEKLGEQLLSGAIDSSTYAALSHDLKYLASKCYPRLYGDKIVTEATVTQRAEVSVNPDKIRALNELMNAGALPAPIDAEFEEK